MLAVLVLLVYHSTRAFDTEAWHLKSADLSRALELFGYAFTPWRLSLLFLITGAGTSFAPPQVYVERANTWMPNRMSPIAFGGSFLAFLPHIFGGAYPNGNLSWHHLWFFVYLFVYSLAALPLLPAHQRAGRRQVEPDPLLRAGPRARG